MHNWTVGIVNILAGECHDLRGTRGVKSISGKRYIFVIDALKRFFRIR